MSARIGSVCPACARMLPGTQAAWPARPVSSLVGAWAHNRPSMAAVTVSASIAIDVRSFSSTRLVSKGGVKPKAWKLAKQKSQRGPPRASALPARLRLAEQGDLRRRSAFALSNRDGAKKRPGLATPLEPSSGGFRHGTTPSARSRTTRPLRLPTPGTTSRSRLTGQSPTSPVGASPFAAASVPATPKIALDARVKRFQSMPLNDGFRQMALGQLDARGPENKGKHRPTPIQSMAVQRFFPEGGASPESAGGFLTADGPGSDTVVAAETGSGKTWAFLLPLLQRLKETEGQSTALSLAAAQGDALVRPRAVLLAPTHELVRQLASAAKDLCHIDKLRVVSLSSGGWLEALRDDMDAIERAQRLDALDTEPSAPPVRPIDLLVATPGRLLDVCKSAEERAADAEREREEARQNPQQSPPGPRLDPADKQQLVSLDAVRAAVVDESDAMLDRDFAPAVTAVIRRLREDRASASDASTQSPPADLIFATASVSAALSRYLTRHHAGARYLISPRLHTLPRTLRTQFVSPGGSRHRALAKHVALALQEDPAAKSKVLVFAEKKKTVEILGEFLESRGIKNVALTGESKGRSMRSNAHLAGFLTSTTREPEGPSEGPADEPRKAAAGPSATPRVLITTSLLSRGLDFHPGVSHIFIPDARSAATSVTGSRSAASAQEISALELLHRAGRGARAGREATLVLFDRDATPEGRRVLKNRAGKTVGRVLGKLERLVQPLIARA